MHRDSSGTFKLILLLVLSLGPTLNAAHAQSQGATNALNGILTWSVSSSGGRCGPGGQYSYIVWNFSSFQLLVPGAAYNLTGSDAFFVDQNPTGCPPPGPQLAYLTVPSAAGFGSSCIIVFTPQSGGGGSASACQSIKLTLPNSGIINTLAGNGTAGYSGDGGNATSAELNSPNAVTADSSGNINISDGGNKRTRVVSPSNSWITEVAGNGAVGYSGDGGPASSAEFSGTCGIATDVAGDLYIADAGNNAIREVSTSETTGVRNVVTVAGTGTAGYSGDTGLATSANLNAPCGVAIDATGNIYIADTSNNVVREVSASTGIISTIAGNGTSGYSGDGGPATSAQLSAPRSVAVDSAGNLYIADSNNERVRKVTISTGNISTVVGNGTAGFYGDGGAATAAELNSPKGIAVDLSGNIYVADTGNQRIREVTASTGDIATVAGNGTAGFSGDSGNATSAELNNPLSVGVDSAGNIYIADSGNNRVRVVGAISSQPTSTSSGSQTTVPYVSGVSVSINNTQQGGYNISTSYNGGSTTSSTFFGGTVTVCNGSCQTITTNAPPQTQTPGGAYTIKYSITVKDATPGATISYTILINGVAHPGSLAVGQNTVNVTVPGGTVLTGTMFATAPGYTQSNTGYLSF